MLVKPPIIDKNITKLKKIDNNITPNETIVTTDTTPYKNRQYKKFIKLIKENKFTNAVITAKILGVNRITIMRWLQTPMIQNALSNELDDRINAIKDSPDWKAHAYLIDKISDDKSDTTPQNIITNIQFILDDKTG